MPEAPVCPICSGDDSREAVDEEGARLCLNRECGAKFAWPQPPAPELSPAAIAAKAVADSVPVELASAVMAELGSRNTHG